MRHTACVINLGSLYSKQVKGGAQFIAALMIDLMERDGEVEIKLASSASTNRFR